MSARTATGRPTAIAAAGMAASATAGSRQGEAQYGDPAHSPQPDIIDPAGTGETGLVETPEAKGESKSDDKSENSAPRKPARKPRSRKPARSGGEASDGAQGGQDSRGGQDGESGEGGPDLSAGPAKAAE
jgi:hypothetical protein